jgi:hypothetical protein
VETESQVVEMLSKKLDFMSTEISKVQCDVKGSVDRLNDKWDQQFEQLHARTVANHLLSERERAEGLKNLVDRERFLADEQNSLLSKWTDSWTHQHMSHNDRVSELRSQANKLEEELEICRKARQSVGLGLSATLSQDIETNFKRSVDNLRTLSNASSNRIPPQQVSATPPSHDLMDDVIHRSLQIVNLGHLLTEITTVGSFDEIATALSVLFDVQKTEYITTMENFLSSNHPSLVKHSALICLAFEGRETEFADSVIMRSLGRHSLDSRTWVHIQSESESFYFSALSGLSQLSKPPFANVAQHIAYRCSCEAPDTLVMPNPSPIESSEGHRQLLCAKITAHFLKKEPLMLDRLPTLMKSYAFRELELWELLESRCAKP